MSMNQEILAKILDAAGPISVFEHLFRHLHSSRLEYIAVGATAMDSDRSRVTPSLTIWIGPKVDNAWRTIEAMQQLKDSDRGNARFIEVTGSMPKNLMELKHFDIKVERGRTRTVRVHIDRRSEFEDKSFDSWMKMSDILNVGGIAVSILPMEYVFWPPPSEDRTVVLAHSISPKRVGVVSRLARRLYNNHKYIYFGILSLLAAAPAAWLFKVKYDKLNGLEHLILPGLHIITVFYLADILQSFFKDKDISTNQKVIPIYLLIVAWLLPFTLTVVPSLEQNINFSILLIEANHKGSQDPNHETADQSTQETLAAEEKTDKILPSICLQTLLVSSLVVFVPLEFFALFFLKDRTGLDRRHLLIAAGCLDIGTLIFLFRIANIELLVSDYHPSTTLNIYFAVVFSVSFLSSFIAIYTSQYREDTSTLHLR